MRPNMFPGDRGLRAFAGLFLLSTPLLELRTYPFNLLGVVLIVTALTGWCPAYAVVSRLRRLFEVDRGHAHTL